MGKALPAAHRRELNLGWLLAAALVLCALLYGVFLLIREDPAERPYMRVLGASFIFNYRVSDVYLGFTAVADRPIPIGSILEARFPDPSGGSDFVVEERIGLIDERVSLRSPSLKGVEAKKPYRIELRLLERQTRREFWHESIEVTSNIGDRVVPEAPLTVGPGNQRPRP
jgi:hypothetical protein